MKHSTALAIAIGPLGLLLLSSSYTHMVAAARFSDDIEQATEVWEEAKLLDRKFLDLQKAYLLLKTGEEKIFTPSLLQEYLKETFDSPLRERALLHASLENMRDAIALLERRFSSIGKQVIHVDLSNQQLALIESGMIIAKYPVSSGASDTPTPIGQFEIHRKQTLRVSNLETPYRMPYYMAFTPNQSHGFHALPYLGESPQASDYWQEAKNHIGIPVSHGCVRLLPEDAEKMYEWIEVGTKVIINT